MLNKSFGEVIREYRKNKGLTVKEFLKALGGISNNGRKLSPAYITKIEAYNEIPKPAVVCKIAEVLGIEVRELLELAKATKIKQIEQSIACKFEKALKQYETIR